eukprot:Tbor_TRINITY_DN1872_c0_g1::TRINITY_DN1872_c0_g1_i1::g.23081::m.23081/K12820/DHX15, PRP43; pre-mRNA-splicing factor ATP-dependent RNA helicase DHX15/PRP43
MLTTDLLKCSRYTVAFPLHVNERYLDQRRKKIRKIVVATNIAETSLTIDGIVFVIDCGFSKQKVYNPKLRVESLLVTPISQAAANQRCGRAGRTRPGKCFRLYTRKAYEKTLQPQTHPEILRCNLGSIVLHMKRIGIDDLVHFDFVDPPSPETLMRALELLNYLGALDDDGNLTEYGKKLSEFPLEPEMAAMLMASDELKCSLDVAKIAAMMSVQSPFIMPNNSERMSAMRSKEQFFHQTGDHLALLNVFSTYEDSGFSSDWCHNNYINQRCMSQACSIFKQLCTIMKRVGINAHVNREQDYEFANNIRKAILRGYFTNVALATPTKNQFLTLKDNVKAMVFPSTFLNRRPQFIVYNELVMTSNTYVRTVTAIADEWLLETCHEYFSLDEFDGLSKQVFETLHRRYNANNKDNNKKQILHEKTGKGVKRSREVVGDTDSDEE